MKSLRISALMLALSAFSIGSIPAHAQQEIDPDHFDQPATAKAAVKAPVHSATAHKQVRGKTSAANHHAKSQSSKRTA